MVIQYMSIDSHYTLKILFLLYFVSVYILSIIIMVNFEVKWSYILFWEEYIRMKYRTSQEIASLTFYS